MKEAEDGGEEGEISADGPEKDVEDDHEREIAEVHDDVAGKPAAEEELRGEDAVGGGEGIPGHDESGADDHLAEDAEGDDEEVEEAAEAGVGLGRDDSGWAGEGSIALDWVGHESSFGLPNRRCGECTCGGEGMFQRQQVRVRRGVLSIPAQGG